MVVGEEEHRAFDEAAVVLEVEVLEAVNLLGEVPPSRPSRQE